MLGLKIDIWVNKKSNLSDLFHTRDVLNLIAMIFTFDDTGLFKKLVGPENALMLIGPETGVKLAAGCLHIAAVVNE